MEITLVRHGATEWSHAMRHTSYTDLALTTEGQAAAGQLGARLTSEYATVLTSPRNRALSTAHLAGFRQAQVREDLTEWNYGDYEGITTAQIRVGDLGWDLWTNGCPGGESPEAIGARADRVLTGLRAVSGPCLVFSHGHFLRVLAARWLGLPVSSGRLFSLDTCSISVLGYERETAVLKRWNS